MDFTLKAYRGILTAAQSANYQLIAIGDWLTKEQSEDSVFLIRHDVDRHPKRALAMAKLEADMGVRSSYYFRIVPASYDEDIISQIHNLGHEIGYHYEDWYLAKFDSVVAIEMFQKHLAMIRKIAPVKTIAMHGSPLSKQSNLEIWKHHDFTKDEVLDVIESMDFSKYAFFTDTGRTFGQTKANLRDEVGSEQVFEEVRSSADLGEFLRGKTHNKIYFSVHPERWTNQLIGFAGQFAKDHIINSIKLGLRMMR